MTTGYHETEAQYELAPVRIYRYAPLPLTRIPAAMADGFYILRNRHLVLPRISMSMANQRTVVGMPNVWTIALWISF